MAPTRLLRRWSSEPAHPIDDVLDRPEGNRLAHRRA